MRHKVAGWKLGRNTSHRRSLLRNLVTSLILEERIETTVPKAKAMRPLVEKMITLGKRGDLSARRQALAYLMTSAAVDKLFDTVAPRFGDRAGRLPAHCSRRLAQRRRRRHGVRRASGQREAAGRKTREARGSPFQACRRSQTGDGRGRSAAGSRASCRPRRRRRQGKGR